MTEKFDLSNEIFEVMPSRGVGRKVKLIPAEKVQTFIKKVKEYKKKIKKYTIDKPGGTYKGFREVIEIPLEDFNSLAGDDLK